MTIIESTDSPASSPSPPPPPPLPRRSSATNTRIAVKISSKVSSYIRTVQEAPNNYYIKSDILSASTSYLSPPCGFYFFYGTLMDPRFLQKLLDLPEIPTLRSAKVTGYSLKLWGHYPALIDDPGGIIHGTVYHVDSEEAAQRLADYETKAYCVFPCTIIFTDEEASLKSSGYVFMYATQPSRHRGWYIQPG